MAIETVVHAYLAADRGQNGRASAVPRCRSTHAEPQTTRDPQGEGPGATQGKALCWIEVEIPVSPPNLAAAADGVTHG